MNKLINGNSIIELDNLIKDDIRVDCIITSPPYDDMREYNNSSNWNFETFKIISQKMFDILKPGGIVVWIVNDKYINGSRSGTTARQQLYFQNIGFLIHDIMIWSKPGFTMPSSNRYHQTYESMLILKKPGDTHTFNHIKDRVVKHDKAYGKNTVRLPSGEFKELKNYRNYNKLGGRYNVWEHNTSGQENLGKKDVNISKHPATFPLALIKDHIHSWTNEGDIVLDPFMGSGTTCLAAKEMNRDFIGIEIDEEYFGLAKNRIGDFFHIDPTANYKCIKTYTFTYFPNVNQQQDDNETFDSYNISFVKGQIYKGSDIHSDDYSLYELQTNEKYFNKYFIKL